MSTNRASTANGAHPAPEKTYFEQQREMLVGEIAQSLELVLQNINKLNRSLEEVTQVGAEFAPVESLWSHFENVMAKDTNENQEGAQEGQTEHEDATELRRRATASTSADADADVKTDARAEEHARDLKVASDDQAPFKIAVDLWPRQLRQRRRWARLSDELVGHGDTSDEAESIDDVAPQTSEEDDWEDY
ncbi:hypothetical protein G6514_002083 [Epicoccum nigrum]|nr:hypothetical protein G6514_002083 [Epicoccum nigrum]